MSLPFLVKKRPSLGLLNHPPTQDAGPSDPYTEAVAGTLLVPMVSSAVSPNVYGRESATIKGQPLIKARNAFSSDPGGHARQDLFPWANVTAQEWYWQQLMPGSQGTITGPRLGTKAVVPIGTQPIPQRGPAYQRTIHGVPLSMAFPTGGDPGS